MSEFERSVRNNVHVKDLTVDVDTMHGLNALIHWLSGFEAGGNHGRVPGGFQLLMLYRTLKQHEVKGE